MENMTYEHLMRRGLKVERHGRKGVDVDVYANFAYDSYEYLNNPKDAKALKAFNKRISEIKGYVEKAFTNSLKRLRGNENGIAEVNDLILRTQQATTKADLDGIIEDGITAFNKYKINH